MALGEYFCLGSAILPREGVLLMPLNKKQYWGPVTANVLK